MSTPGQSKHDNEEVFHTPQKWNLTIKDSLVSYQEHHLSE